MDFTTLAWIDAEGYHFVDFPTMLAAVQTAFQGIYGSDVYLGADSQDGQWTTIIAQGFYDMAALGAAIYNSFSPVTAQGVGLSRNVKINGLTRGIPTNSAAVLTIGGIAGAVINNGIAVDVLNQQWILPASVTIPDSGTINVTATAQNQGAVTAAPFTITGIFTPTLGWQTVTNASAATVGAAVETDGALRVRQQNSTGLPAQTVINATEGALNNLAGITGVQAYENDTDDTDDNGLTAHSVCFVVNGTADLQQIANVIGVYKTPGTNTFSSGVNAQSETYTDPNGMEVPINFISPAVLATISVEFNLTPLSGWDTNSLPLIKSAVAAAISALPIGGIVVLSSLYIPAYLIGTPSAGTYSISDLEIEKNSGAFAAADIDLDFDEIATCVAADVTITVE